MGANRLVEPATIVEQAQAMLAAPPGPTSAVPLWDGKAAQRAALVLRGFLSREGSKTNHVRDES